MEAMMMQFKDLQIIPFEEITIATNNFHKDNYLGGGGFGNVYKGELSRFKDRGMVAFKRLNPRYGQGKTEFLKEISMLSKYKHENLISLLGVCIKEKEMILVYEYASHRSLDFHLRSRDLTWTQRLKICLQAAEGLRYLHDPNESHLVLIHRDIKSANILLDDGWNAKVSDFGLSKISHENANLVTVVTGTPGYIDPEYHETYMLTEHSDVYSFGITLFEVLCGSLCYETIGVNNVRVFVHKWKESYQENKLEEIIFKEPGIGQMDKSSLKLFSGIAYQCLEKSGEKRPTMVEVVSKLKAALQAQERYDVILKISLPKEYAEIVRAAVSHPIYSSIEQLKDLLSEGILVNEGKTWLSLNDKGEHHLMVSIEEYLSLDDPNSDYSDRYSSKEKSRFSVGCYNTSLMEFKLRVTPPLFLSPDVTYGLNLVFHSSEIEGMKQKYVGVGYKLQGHKKISILHFADKKEGKELVAELYQFNSTEESILDLEIFLEDCGLTGDYYIEGIEFRPLKKVESTVVVANKEIARAVIPPLFYGFTEEPEVFLSQGVLLNKGKTWLSINEKGEHIERIYIEACLNLDEIEARDLLHPSGDIVNSSFPGGLCYEYIYSFEARVRGEYLTPHISYTLNLVFRYADESEVNYHNPLRYKIDGEEKVFIIYPIDMREDGWFIVPLYHFTTQHTTADLQFEFEYRSNYLLVAGIEFQPSEEKVQLPVFEEYQHIVDAASQSLFYTSLDELKQILSKGILLNRGRTWFSLNEKGEHCHMISIEDCLIPNEDSTPRYESNWRSRFPAGFYLTNNEGFKTHVKAQFLSPSITYTVNLVYKTSSEGEQVYAGLKYRLKGEVTTSVVHLANQRDDDLHMAELYQFTSDGTIVDLEIILENSGTSLHVVEGILFQPLEIVEDQVSKDDKVENIQTISNSDSDSLIRTTKEKLYSIFRRRSIIDNGQQWLSVDKHGKKCLLLSAKETWVDYNNSAFKSSHESRFGEVLVVTSGHRFLIKREVKPNLSPETTYAAYLVYKLPQDQSTFEDPLCVWKECVSHFPDWYIYLVSPPHTPVIGPKFDENTYNPLSRYKGTAIPQQRTDGWMEVKVWEFQTTNESVSMDLMFGQPGSKDVKGLIVQGIELRPI